MYIKNAVSAVRNISNTSESAIPQNITRDIAAQLRCECDKWKRELYFMQGENVRLKTRLSEILKDGIDNNLLEEIENFQSRFIREDDVIGLLRNEVADLDRILTNEAFESGVIRKKVDGKLKSLRHTITATGKDFIKLKSEFNSYIVKLFK